MPIQVSYAPTLYRLLNGVFCLYKDRGIPTGLLKHQFLAKLAQDLNLYTQRPLREVVSIDQVMSSEEEKYKITIRSDLADHPLVVGPRNQPQDFACYFANELGKESSGLVVFGIGEDGSQMAKRLQTANFVRSYEVTCKFGRMTSTGFESGRTVEKTTYKGLSLNKLKTIISKVVSSHRPLIFQSLGVDLHSQEAYNLMSSGLTRPFSYKTAPLLFGMRCTYFSPPDFTLALQTVNEEEHYLAHIIHGIGIQMKSSASVTSLRCTRYGHFVVEDALLEKEWTAENVINNIVKCKHLTTEDKLCPMTPHVEKRQIADRNFLTMIDEGHFSVCKREE